MIHLLTILTEPRAGIGASQGKPPALLNTSYVQGAEAKGGMSYLYYPIHEKPGLAATPVHVLGRLSPVEGPHMKAASQHPAAESMQSLCCSSIHANPHIRPLTCCQKPSGLCRVTECPFWTVH